MNKIVPTNQLEKRELPFLTDEAFNAMFNKKWSFTNIYHPNLLKDIYALITIKKIKKPSDLYKLKYEINFQGEDLSDRLLLEYLTGLKKFDVLTETLQPKKKLFVGSNLNEKLTKNDIEDLAEIFFDYYRFKEISSWFINPMKSSPEQIQSFTKENFIQESNPLFYFSLKTRFIDSFITDIYEPKFLYQINDEMTHQMRFFRVFLKWGTELNVLDKISLSALNVKSENGRNISMAYFIKPFEQFNLMSFLKKKFENRHIFIPELIFKIAFNTRFSVLAIKDYLVNQLLDNDGLTYERTSEIFIIKGAEDKKQIENATYFYPMINGYYISHLIVRK